MPEEYQSIIITFSDGSTAIFTGQVSCRPGDIRTITNIKFTEPKELPKDMHFEKNGE